MNSPIVILARPQMGENIGAAARIMANFDVKELRLIAPRDGWPNAKALDMAKGGAHIVKKARVFSQLSQACTDIDYLLATTARPRDMVKEVLTPEESATRCEQHKQTALLFGAERSGLSNEEIILCDAIISIPVSATYPSLNLAQAVAITLYEIAAKKQTTPITGNTKEEALADKATIHAMLDQLTQVLDNNNFFRVPEKREKMLHNIHNIFTRSQLTEQEVRTLRGIWRCQMGNDE